MSALVTGRSIDVGGSSLYIECAGQGPPTVVFENGLGVSVDGWALIQPHVAQFARTCMYDRAGIGRSQPRKRPIDALVFAHDLHALLVAAGESGPYVLVGHSIGGIYIRMFTHLYPNEVAALVFVDSSHPEQKSRLPIPAWARAVESLFRLAPLLARSPIPVLRFLAERMLPKSDYPPEVAERLLVTSTSATHLASALAENAALDAIFAQGRMLGNLGDRPIAIISAGMPRSQLVSAVHELHSELATLSTRSTRRIIDDGTHMSVIGNCAHAQIVVEAISEVCETVRPT